MASRPLSQVHFQSPRRSPLGAVLLAGRHIDLPILPPMPTRTLDRFALVLVLAGKALHENTFSKLQPVGPGDMILIFPAVAHRYFVPSSIPPGSQPQSKPRPVAIKPSTVSTTPSNTSTWSEAWIHFQGTAFDHWRDSGVISPSQPIIRAGSPRYWLNRLQTMSVPDGLSSPSPLQRVCMLQELLADALQRDSQRQHSPDDQAWLASALELLEPRLGRRTDDLPDLKKIARHMGMTYEGFRKRFSRLTGHGPAHHHASALLTRAADLLKNPDLSLAQVADACGYCDQFHFSRQFKKHLGIGPAQYRRHALNP